MENKSVETLRNIFQCEVLSSRNMCKTKTFFNVYFFFFAKISEELKHERNL